MDLDLIKDSFSLIHQWFAMALGDISETNQWFVSSFFYQPLQSMVLSEVYVTRIQMSMVVSMY